MARTSLCCWSVVAALALTACASAPSQPAARPAAAITPSAVAAASPSRTLILLLRSEPTSLSGTIFIRTTTTSTQRRLFNAALALLDGDDKPIPYLAEALPQLNTDAWRVSPDGRMETTYRLRPNLVWQDGTPLSAQDFVFAWRVYTTPELGISSAQPQSEMEDIAAPDDRTVVVHWRRPYPDAGALVGVGAGDRNFAPLPRHILGTLNLQDRDSFLGSSYWTTDYVGLGPYRVDRWEPGAFVEAAAFDRHALGRPKIDRVRLVWNADANAALAALLSGAAHMPADDPIRFEQGQILKREWVARGAGTVTYRPTLWRFTQVQQRPDYASSRALLDVRVRKALASTIDRQALNDGLFDGDGLMADTVLYPTAAYAAALDRAVTKYPLDPQRAAQLMADAGYRKGADGMYESPSEGHLAFELKTIAGAQSDAERAIMAAGWRGVGFDVAEATMSAAESGDLQTMATFRSLMSNSGPGGEDALASYTTDAIMRPETRWAGRNRGGWSNADYDRAVDAFQTTLDRSQRDQQAVQAAKVLSDDVGVISLYFNPSVMAYPTELKGVDIRSADGEMTWNIDRWEFQ